MSTEEKPLTPFETFAARRIAEFPTLYTCAEDVICGCILSSRGEYVWEKGILVTSQNQYFDKAKKRWTKYPLRMPLKTASKLHSYAPPKVQYDMGYAGSPITQLPHDAEESFLQEIDLFLFKWSGLGEPEWKALATAYCITMWGMFENKHASEPSRKLADYLNFMKLIPKWRADIREIEYFQQYGEVDVRTFQGMDI